MESFNPIESSSNRTLSEAERESLLLGLEHARVNKKPTPCILGINDTGILEENNLICALVFPEGNYDIYQSLNDLIEALNRENPMIPEISAEERKDPKELVNEMMTYLGI